MVFPWTAGTLSGTTKFLTPASRAGMEVRVGTGTLVLTSIGEGTWVTSAPSWMGRQAHEILPAIDRATDIKVYGSGYGHGVGLSQFGAHGRALAGQDYVRILQAYYQGVSLRQYQDDPTVRVLLGERDLNRCQEVVVCPGTEALMRNLATDGTAVLRPGTYQVQYLANRELHRLMSLSDGRAVGSYRGPIRFEPISEGLLGFGHRRYRGFLTVQTSSSRVCVINQLPVESYIRGVVANEMFASWPLEALKSQAIAARSYARATRNDKEFDVYPDVRNQVYGGASSETLATNEAVASTARICAVYDGSPIVAAFHSASGGYTEDASFVFDTPRTLGSAPYLKASRDVDSEGRPFEGPAYANAPWASWHGALDAHGSPGLKIGTIVAVTLLGRSPSGRLTKIKVTGTQGEKIICGEYDIRCSLKTTGLRLADGSVYPAGTLPSARVSFVGAACAEERVRR
jgi:stage II sporulation protein D